jgi:hypothetical protein
MLRFLYLALLISLLTACVAAPTRSDPGAFALTQSGQIPASNTQPFTDCLMDGFDSSSAILTNVSVRQQRRTERYRVEVLTHSSVLLSADVFDNGRVELYESSTAALINLSGERKAFADCLSRFRMAS